MNPIFAPWLPRCPEAPDLYLNKMSFRYLYFSSDFLQFQLLPDSKSHKSFNLIINSKWILASLFIWLDAKIFFILRRLVLFFNSFYMCFSGPHGERFLYDLLLSLISLVFFELHYFSKPFLYSFLLFFNKITIIWILLVKFIFLSAKHLRTIVS